MQMEKLVSLCKRRGFLFQSSEIYGGLNGFWDYGPLGVELKRNIKDAWWRDMVTGHDDLSVPERSARRLRDDGARLHHHHASAGLEVFRSLRLVPRLSWWTVASQNAVIGMIRSAGAGWRPRGSESLSRRWSRWTKERKTRRHAHRSSSSSEPRMRTRFSGTDQLSRV